MPNILFTGAGFSHNWGGWLASEAFEYLLGTDDIHPRIRTLLWNHKEKKTGFEGVYTELKGSATNPTDQEVFMRFNIMVAGMFHTMQIGFASAQIDANVLKFLAQFDAIFTLNQDTLLELKYLALGQNKIRELSDGVFLGAQTPGLRKAQDVEYMPPSFYTPDEAPFKVKERFQPYFKLHGSSNWAASSDGKLMLILGGNKEVEIPKHPLLAWYHSEFERRAAGCQLVIIGYSFSDEYINRLLSAAVRKGTRFFIIDPQGVDVIDKRQSAQILQPRTAFMESIMGSIDGASRRSLLSTLSTDRVERTKLHHFLTAAERKR